MFINPLCSRTLEKTVIDIDVRDREAKNHIRLPLPSLVLLLSVSMLVPVARLCSNGRLD